MILMILWFQGHEASESCFSPNMRVMILLTHFMLSASFYFPGKQKKTFFFFSEIVNGFQPLKIWLSAMSSAGIERDQWREMGYCNQQR